MRLTTYDFNLDAYDNIKNNILQSKMAKNRWGNKFKKLFLKHDEMPISGTIFGVYSVISPYKYDFTAGMAACVKDSRDFSGDLAEIEAFRSLLRSSMSVNTNGIWGTAGAIKSSFISVVIEKTTSPFFFTRECAVKGYKIALCLDNVQAGDTDARRASYLYSWGEDSTKSCTLEPLKNETDTWGLSIYKADGSIYGHYDNQIETTHNIIQTTFTVEDQANVLFDANQTSEFTAMHADLMIWLKRMVETSRAYSTLNFGTDNRSVVLIGLGQLLSWIDLRRQAILDLIEIHDTNPDRIDDDLALIEHLGMCENLKDQIENPSDVDNIWIEFKKEYENITAVWVKENPEDNLSPLIIDPNWQWWMNSEFDEIRAEFKDFYLYCDIRSSTSYTFGFGCIVTIKSDAIENLSGAKVYALVRELINIDVDMDDGGFFEQLLNFVLFVIAIVLTVITENPAWLKIIMLVSVVVSFSGALPELQLFLTVITFLAGAYSTSLAAMTSMEVFRWAIQNINMIVKMYNLYEGIGFKEEIEALAKEKNKDKSLAQLQDETLEFIYTTAYSQYDMMYNLMYNYEPNYKNN